MSLWNYGLADIPKPAERKSIITLQRAQSLYDQTAREASGIKTFRQANFGYLGDTWKVISNVIVQMEEILPGLLSELAMERHAGPYPATPHAVAPDAKWLNDCVPWCAHPMLECRCWSFKLRP